MKRAQPDAIVLVFPTPWEGDESDLLSDVHDEFWVEDLTVELVANDDEPFRFSGRIVFDDGFEAGVVVEDAIPELETLSSNTLEPYAASELAMLQQHVTTWRVTLPKGGAEGRNNALRAAKLMSTFVQSGASGAFLPALVRLHSPGTVKQLSMDLDRIENLVSLVVSAWHADEWMVTRGLTAFALPELETPIDSGFNGAYFRLMDLAAGMLHQSAPFPPGSQIEMGPKLYSLSEGRNGPEDEQVPHSGHFGTQSLLPTT